MREPSVSLRELRHGAVGASPAVPPVGIFGPAILKRLALALATAAFLSFVGAFGAEAIAPLPRLGLFIALALACFGVVAAVLQVADRSAALATRPSLKQGVIVAVVAPATATLVWGVLGLTVYGAPRLSQYPGDLLAALGLTLAVSTLARLMFRDPERGVQGSATPQAPQAASRFMERLPAPLRGADIYAVAAEDHYVRVYTARGSDLILFRLADAEAELVGQGGARVHRSWWVARAAVTGAVRRRSQTLLTLKGGVEAPVSRSQAAALRRAGWFS